ncbi:hypothetical protein NG99_22485 [Erwinia typographi]|uniref:Uncharacterized protein n=1 Tax=Erwinia typographi TaxID=371042 RepID=A0A0A3YQY9_9GAMM|nr:hypothetical protein [Erwinia typographi]KGT87929.1 hypothetical protein NG99_22485 [Erwinia typographi]
MKSILDKPDVLFVIRDIIRETLMGNAALGLIISAIVHFTSKANLSVLDTVLRSPFQHLAYSFSCG